ncbi:hypothetical protein COP2_013131 [Malus domestica]
MHSNGVQVVQHLQYGGYNRSSESSPLSSENSMIIEGMSKACPYSLEEKRLRIAIAYRDSKYVILWVVAQAPAWELFLFPRSERNTQIE